MSRHKAGCSRLHAASKSKAARRTKERSFVLLDLLSWHCLTPWTAGRCHFIALDIRQKLFIDTLLESTDRYHKMKLIILSVLLSSVQGFPPPVPAEMGVVVDKLMDPFHSFNAFRGSIYVWGLKTDSLEMAAKTALVPLILYAPFVRQPRSLDPVLVDGEIDYDAPLERQLKVGHVVRRQPFTLGFAGMGTFTLPGPITQALHLYEPEHKFKLPTDSMDEHYWTVVHDECYLGKDMTAHDCVDFDPMHKSK